MRLTKLRPAQPTAPSAQASRPTASRRRSRSVATEANSNIRVSSVESGPCAQGGTAGSRSATSQTTGRRLGLEDLGIQRIPPRAGGPMDVVQRVARDVRGGQ
jgi:hypothetical protein